VPVGTPSEQHYSERHLDPSKALEYRSKFDKSLIRRLSNLRERAIVGRALKDALDALPPTLISDGSPRLLDMPCGAGRFAPLLAAKVGTYVYADHSEHMIELCRQALYAHGIDIGRTENIRGDAREIPLPTSSVDLAFCIRLLHHFADPEDQAKIIGELARVSAGPVVVSFLDADSFKQWMYVRRNELAGRTARRITITQDALRELAGDAGLRVARIWSLSGMFSGQSLALLLPTPGDDRGTGTR